MLLLGEEFQDITQIEKAQITLSFFVKFID
jgi:hypothetical protein